MKKLVFLCIVVVMAAALAVPMSSTRAQDKTKIDVWIAFQDYRLDWAQGVAAKFNEEFPQYEVTITGGYSYETMFAQVAVAAEQHQLPAIVQYFEAATQDARDSNLFKPIADAIGDRTEINGLKVDLEDYIAPVIAYYTVDGKFSSMPWNTSSALMFSNMKILNEAGFDKPPATWGEVEAVCEKVMALSDHPEYCFTFPNHGWFFEQWLAQQNALYVNNDNGRSERATEVAFNSEAGVAVLTWLNDLYDKGYLYYSGAQGGDSWSTVDQAYSTQQVAMAAYSSSDTTLYTQMGVDGGFESLASFLPYNDATGWTGNLIGGATLWLTDGLDPAVEDGALTFLLYFTNTENAADWHKVTGYVAIRNSSNELLKTEGWFDANPNQTVAADELSQSTVTPATSGALVGGFPSIRNEVTAAIDRVLLTDDDPKAVLDDAAKKANAIIEEYNLLNVP